jgi:hypothetical protein
MTINISFLLVILGSEEDLGKGMTLTYAPFGTASPVGALIHERFQHLHLTPRRLLRWLQSLQETQVRIMGGS